MGQPDKEGGDDESRPDPHPGLLAQQAEEIKAEIAEELIDYVTRLTVLADEESRKLSVLTVLGPSVVYAVAQ